MCWKLQLQPLEWQDGTGHKVSWQQYEDYFGCWKQLSHVSGGAVRASWVCCSAERTRQGRALPGLPLQIQPRGSPGSSVALWSLEGLLQLPQPSCPLPCISLGTHCSTEDKKRCYERKVSSNNAIAHTHTQKREIFINNSAFIYIVSMALLCQTPSVLSRRPFSLLCSYSQPVIFQRLRECSFIHRLNKLQAWRNVTHQRWHM